MQHEILDWSKNPINHSHYITFEKEQTYRQIPDASENCKLLDSCKEKGEKETTNLRKSSDFQNHFNWFTLIFPQIFDKLAP